MPEHTHETPDGSESRDAARPWPQVFSRTERRSDTAEPARTDRSVRTSDTPRTNAGATSRAKGTARTNTTGRANTRVLLGRRGEDAAAKYLIRLGWVVLDRNWRCPEGELDIVARDRRELVICEVKTRSGLACGAPAEAITPVKAARLRRLAMRWAAQHGYGTSRLRIDVIGLLAGAAGGPDRFAIDHLRGVC